MSSVIDLTLLPTANIIEPLDFETILGARKARLVELTPADQQADVAATLAIASEPIVKLLEENAYRELLLRQRINEAARAVTLALSAGADLDQMAANLNTARQVLSPGDPTATPPVPPTVEPDADLRVRAQMAYEGLSVAGPSGAYVYHSLSADAEVADVTAVSPLPCEVLVTVLSRTGDGTASPALLDKVMTALSDEDIRPVGDRVTVQSATIVPYTIDATIYMFPGPEAELIRAAAETALQTFITTQRRLGRDIRRSALFAALHVEGVQRVELTEPALDLVLDTSQAAWCSLTSVTVGGVDA